MGSLLEILTKRSQTFYISLLMSTVSNVVGKSISSIAMYITVNQLGNFSCGSVVNNLQYSERVSHQINNLTVWSGKIFNCVFVTSHTRFVVNLHYVAAYMSRSSLLEAGAISATGIDPITT